MFIESGCSPSGKKQLMPISLAHLVEGGKSSPWQLASAGDAHNVHRKMLAPIDAAHPVKKRTADAQDARSLSLQQIAANISRRS